MPSKLASQADLWYNEEVKIVAPAVLETPKGWIHLTRRCIMDTLPLHALDGKTTFIYALIDPETEQVRYVGKTNNTQRRLKQHLKDRRKTHKTNWIKSLLLRDLEPIMHILEEIPLVQWQERERYWIAYYRLLGCPLTNGSDGGDGITNPTPEECARRAEQTRRIMSDPVEKLRRISFLNSPASIAKRVATKNDHPLDITRTTCLKISQAKRKSSLPRNDKKRIQKNILTSSRATGNRIPDLHRDSFKKDFLEKFQLSGNVLDTCREIGIARQTFYQWLKGDVDFKLQYEEIASQQNRKRGRHISPFERNQAQETFLQIFASSGNVRLASLKSGISRQTLYQWTRLDEQFSCRYLEIRDALGGLSEQ